MASPLTITTIQTNLQWEDKTANLQMLEEKIMGIKEKTEIVILPEMFNTGFSMNPEKLAETMEGETVQWMKKVAAKKKIILTGSVIIQETGQVELWGEAGRKEQVQETGRKEQVQETGRKEQVQEAGQKKQVQEAGLTETVRPGYYNRLIWMLPNGQYGFYDKRHRFAYAGEDKQFSAGSKRFIASVNGWKINLLVCYDLRFPVWARQTPLTDSNAEYDVLVYVANWPERRNHAWKTLLQARAIENQCYVVGVNRVGDDGNNIHHSGDSMVVDPMGEVLYSKKEEEDVFTITLDRDHVKSVREKLPFLKDADDFLIVNPRE